MTSDPVNALDANPHLNPLPFCWGRGGRSRQIPTDNERALPSNFPQILPVRFFHLKASQRELLDPSAARSGLPSAENQPARDSSAKFLCRAH